MAWFKKTKEIRTDKKGKTPEGLWVKCDGCKEIIYKKEIEKNLKVCPKCNYHFRISARERLKLLIEEGSFVEIDEGLVSVDPLNFKDSISYKDRIKENQRKTLGKLHQPKALIFVTNLSVFTELMELLIKIEGIFQKAEQKNNKEPTILSKYPGERMIIKIPKPQ